MRLIVKGVNAATEPHPKVLYCCHTFRLSQVQHRSMRIVLQSHKFEHTANFFTYNSTLHTFVTTWHETWKWQAGLANQTISFRAANFISFLALRNFTWVHTNHATCCEHCQLYPSSQTFGFSTLLSCKFIPVFAQCNVEAPKWMIFYFASVYSCVGDWLQWI